MTSACWYRLGLKTGFLPTFTPLPIPCGTFKRVVLRWKQCPINIELVNIGCVDYINGLVKSIGIIGYRKNANH